MNWPAKLYKRCDKCCQKCKQCRDFEKIIEQIDLEERSVLDRQRQVDKERRER